MRDARSPNNLRVVNRFLTDMHQIIERERLEVQDYQLSYFRNAAEPLNRIREACVTMLERAE